MSRARWAVNRSAWRAELRRAGGVLAIVALGPLLGAPRDAFAQADRPVPANVSAAPPRPAVFSWDDKVRPGASWLRARFDYKDAFDADLAKKLSSGFRNFIVMRAYVFQEGVKEPIALAVHSCQVTYDLWDDIYRVRVNDTGAAERRLPKVNVEGVLRECAEAHDLLIVDRALLKRGAPHFLGVLVEVNPISPDLEQQIVQWVQRPAGSTGIAAGDALFSQAVGVFVRQLGTADRTLTFRTPTFTP
jgi:hypothetical protein